MQRLRAMPLCLNIILLSSVRAMDMSGSSSNTSSESMAMMIPYLHFTGGDYLFFDTVAPISKGAIAGACIVLVVLAILERGVAGARGIFAYQLIHRQQALQRQTPRTVASKIETPRVDQNTGIEEVSTLTTTSQTSPFLGIRPLSTQRPRTVASFVWSHKLVRGSLFVVQSFFVYAIMLAVMSFNGAYIISIIAGTAIGEIMFGRFTAEQNH